VTGAELVTLLDAALARLADARDELRSLDAALGDGDLGITVEKGCAAVRAKLAELDDPSPAEVLRSSGAAFATANPSTFAALSGGGLLAAAKAVADATELDRDGAVTVARAVADSIATRGKAELGDKTVLDALVPSVDALERADGDGDGDAALAAMVDAARRGVEETAWSESRRGRASWLRERSAGRPDPGATAYVRLLESLAAANGADRS
jgi:phosphoenolpyruvate---glycerone phosphotransferase subunit DhaL